MKPNIAVLMGGRSLERTVSLKSGKRVSQALKDLGHPIVQLDVDEQLVPRLREEKPDLAYIALHGKYGEDGTIQELLEILGIPFTGPGALSCIIGFDKVLSKELFRAESIPTPKFFALSTPTLKEMGAAEALPLIWEQLGSPLVVKPAAQGSALGVKIVENQDSLPSALITALGYDDKVLLEEHIEGVEIAIGVIGNESPDTLPPVEIVPQSGFFDFESRYAPGATDYYVPARIPKEQADAAAEMALRVHRLLDCRGLSRVDMIVSPDGTPYVLELNASPGMTEVSLVPMAANAAGMEFSQLVEKLVVLALES